MCVLRYHVLSIIGTIAKTILRQRQQEKEFMFNFVYKTEVLSMIKYFNLGHTHITAFTSHVVFTNLEIRKGNT